MEARSQRGRHLARVFVDDDGRRIGCYGGLVNGQVHVGHGGGGGAVREAEPDELARDAVERAARIGRALLDADRLHPGTRAILELRFRRDLAPERAAFGTATGRQRGCGNVAHLTDAAIGAFEQSRTRLETCEAWVDRLGSRLAASTAGAVELALGAQIAREAESLVDIAIERFRRHLSRVPAVVERRARRALTAA